MANLWYNFLMQTKPPENNLSEISELLEIVDLQERLNMSFEERIEAHENARMLLEDLKLAGENERAKSQGAS
ncbi:MAG: hypothetical protein ACXWRE_00140 [Pseudobdellovibrionaceae bacterium]